MKKLVLLLAVVSSASLFSCNNSKNEAAAADTVAVDTVEAVVLTDTVVAVDTVNGDTVVATEAVAAVAQ